MLRHSHDSICKLAMKIPLTFSVGMAQLLLSLHLCAQVSFAPAVNYTVGTGPCSIVAVDVNGDGKVDLVCANRTSNSLTVLTNNGSGVFGLNAGIGVGVKPSAVVAVDVNGDGKMDLICANYGDNTLTLVTNNGKGQFAYSATYTVGSGPTSLIATDLNGDGKNDLASANYGVSGVGTVTALVNNGSGSFYTSGTFLAGYAPESITSADVNDDGKNDLIVANQTGSLTVLTNYGGGSLGSNATYNVGGEPSSVTTADVNGDGKMDLIWANMNGLGNSISVLTNNGHGRFTTSGIYSVGSEPEFVMAADINGDGKIDLISANWLANTLTLLTNNGIGSFVLAATLAVGNGPQSVVAADVNGDGKIDLITANKSSNTISILLNSSGSLQIIINPVGALTAGARWQLDGGAWQSNGAFVYGLSGGGHTVSFLDLTNWITPLPQVISINTNQANTVIGVYVQPVGTLQVNISPPGAVNAGAQWQVDGNVWQNSANCVSNLALGSHSISFSTVAGWATPSNQNVTINYNQKTLATGTYYQQFGSLQVNLSPASAVNSGAQWQVDGGVWQNNGTVVAGLTLGSHTVSFSVAPGWGTPGSQVVTVNANQTTIASASYLAPHPATAMAIVTNGFVVSVALSDGGIGYTNTPLVYLLGGGGTGAHALAVVSNGYVTGFTIIDPGHGYTNVPVVAINPPYQLSLGIESATAIGFTNLQIGTNYQLQMSQSGVWANFGAPFVAVAGNYTQYFDSAISGPLYQLMALPIPYAATATPILSFGFLVAVAVNDGGSGYVTIPGVQITGGGGSEAQATATLSNGVVTAVNVSNPGIGYSSSPTIQIDPPPIPSLQAIATKVVRLDFRGLTPGLGYQLQSAPDLIGWTNFGTVFSAADYTNSQYLNFDSNSRYLRLWQP